VNVRKCARSADCGRSGTYPAAQAGVIPADASTAQFSHFPKNGGTLRLRNEPTTLVCHDPSWIVAPADDKDEFERILENVMAM